MVLARNGLALSVDERDHCIQRYSGSILGGSAQKVVDVAHMLSAYALGVARGLNDTPKVLALLVTASWAGFDTRTSLLVIASAMAAGGLLHSRRLRDRRSRTSEEPLGSEARRGAFLRLPAAPGHHFHLSGSRGRRAGTSADEDRHTSSEHLRSWRDHGRQHPRQGVPRRSRDDHRYRLRSNRGRRGGTSCPLLNH